MKMKLHRPQEIISPWTVYCIILCRTTNIVHVYMCTLNIHMKPIFFLEKTTEKDTKASMSLDS